jgi:hypothetical protein
MIYVTQHTHSLHQPFEIATPNTPVLMFVITVLNTIENLK